MVSERKVPKIATKAPHITSTGQPDKINPKNGA